jgi:acyl-ACP thioesterase
MTGRLERTFKIMVRHCDENGKLALHELFKFMQDCAISHADELGVGMNDMAGSGKTFILSRVGLDVIDMPGLHDELQVITYPSGIDRLFYVRDFEIYCRKRLVASARTLWLVIDLSTRRPDRKMARTVSFPFHINEQLGLSNPLKPDAPSETEPVYKSTVMHTDIDVLRHANNSCYVRWTSDCLGSTFFGKVTSYKITVNFSLEMKKGDEIYIYREGLSFLGKNGEGRETFRAFIEH